MAAEDVITAEDAKDHLNMTEDVDDNELAVHVSAASQLVEWFVGPVIIREFTDYDVVGYRALVLDRRPIVELVSVQAFSGAVVDPAGLRVNPTAGIVRPAGGGRLPGGPFDVTYRAGRAESVNTVPDALALACRIIVANMWATQRAPQMGPQSGGFDEFAPAATGVADAIPYRARDLMAPFRTVGFA